MLEFSKEKGIKKSIYAYSTLLILPLLGSIYIISRLLYLDADIPWWDISYYCQIDELYYTTYAFQLFQGIDHRLVNYISGDYINGTNLIEQLFTYISLVFLGNNYYGLRMPSVFLGAFSLITLYLIFKKRFGVYIAFFSGFIFIACSGFLLATRIAEPSIFKIGFMFLVLYLLNGRKEHQKYSLFLDLGIGFVVGFSVFFVYPTNFFIIPSAIAVYLFSPRSLKQGVFNKNNVMLISGIVLSLISYIIFLYLFIEMDFDFYSILTPRLYNPKKVHFLLHSYHTIISILEDSSFFKNSYFKILFEVAIVFCILKIIVNSLWLGVFAFKKDNPKKVLRNYLILKSSDSKFQTDIIMFMFFSFLVGQTLFLNDYPQRKLIILFPFVLYISAYFIYSVKDKLNKYFPKLQFLFTCVTSIMLSFIIILDIKISYNIVYKAPTFDYKTAMESLNKKDLDLVVGGWSFGFRLYNNFHTAINKCSYWYQKRSEYYSLINSLSKQFVNVKVIEYMNDEIKNDLYRIGFTPEKVILKSTDKSYPDVAIYRQIGTD
ncbi:ArnT family glycosyltransferase [Legionella waltersii]|uniref:Glycosyltransferase RgtA/B/C/D-like domain-containing protein n=1 Tax=Legionella waltersii TaxID=66969 RepID=A0A0W1AN85_9GAMM|nr:glycosyltransferase family 39 protein [Legionella waltersii]KTD82750.1 hypothetical protein Lwal_0228 [Legionella waltersii]SNV01092.1 Uncharacterised protein [Legionella waltersii]